MERDKQHAENLYLVKEDFIMKNSTREDTPPN